MADPAPTFIAQERPALRSRIIFEGGVWLFNIALLAFIAAVVLAGGFFFYQRSLEATRLEWAQQVEGQEAELKPELLSQLTDLSNSLTIARELLSGHSFASNVFLFIQSITHPRVQFSAFTFSRDSRKIEISGAAASYQTVAEQISLMEAHSQVEKVEFGGLARGDKGLVNFKLAIIFKPSLLQLRSQ